MPFSANPILTQVYRGDLVESHHRGSVAITQDGKLKFHLGDVERSVYLRSSAKLIQALPVVLSGAADAAGLEEEEIAILCGSHNGEDPHVEVVRRILQKAGVGEEALKCGCHEPADAETRRRLDSEGIPLSPLRNNCSGKHAGLLTLATFLKADLETYCDSGHPVQEMFRSTLAELAEERPENLVEASDGCTSRIYALPLWKSALVYERLANPEEIERHELRCAVERVKDAVQRHPYMIAGRNRLCTDLLRSGQRSILCKGGAEGFYALGLTERHVGFAVKVDDGSPRGYQPVVLRFLDDQEVFSPEVSSSLSEYREPPVRNLRGEEVGRIAVSDAVAFPRF
ncbi:MAG: asparaginase [Armatimonadetes bacterium]|nr:asparaginase [Armatimonadota bacterium]